MMTVGVRLGPALAVAVRAAGLGVAVGHAEGFPISARFTSRRHPGSIVSKHTLNKLRKVIATLNFVKMRTSQNEQEL